MPNADAALHRSDSRPLAPSSLSEIERYYDSKTARIVAKYGPGPRIHFHTGLDARAMPDGATQLELRKAMVDSQEALLVDLGRNVRGARILDVGCGLGGGAIHWAKTGADVTAITNVARHVPLVASFAAQANVSARAIHCDAHSLDGLGEFDCAIAVESSCYFDRRRWFSALARVLPSGGRVHIVDCFFGRSSAAQRFDDYWRTRIGARDEYDALAREAGFELERQENLNERVIAFWQISLSWTRAELSRDANERGRLLRSMDEHTWLQRSLATGDIVYASCTYELNHRSSAVLPSARPL